MKKHDAISLFGSASKTAKAVRVTPAAVSLWPEILSDAIADRVIAAAMRQGIEIPPELLKRDDKPAQAA